MALYGYARISKKTENIERQIRNISKAYPDAIIKREVYSGRTTDRPVFTSLLGKLQKGDTLVLDAVSRFSRASDEGFALYKKLYQKGVNIVFLKQPQMNTEVYRGSVENRIDLTVDSGDKATDKFLSNLTEVLNDYMMDIVERQFKIAFDQAEAEVKNLSQRTKEGIETARINGKKVGRPKGSKTETAIAKRTKLLIMTQSKAFGGTYRDIDLIEMAGVCRNSYFKYKKECREQKRKEYLEQLEGIL
jgi:DNA invertase Pin-like site-specific DNA recombinase